MERNKKITLELEDMPAIDLIHTLPYKHLKSEEIYEASVKTKKVDRTVILCGHRHIQGQIDYDGCWNVDNISLDYDVEKLILA